MAMLADLVSFAGGEGRAGERPRDDARRSGRPRDDERARTFGIASDMVFRPAVGVQGNLCHLRLIYLSDQSDRPAVIGEGTVTGSRGYSSVSKSIITQTHAKHSTGTLCSL